MQIVHLLASRFFGGPERQMLGLAQALPRAYRTLFLSFPEDGLGRSFLGHVRERGFSGLILGHDTPRLLAAFRDLAGLLRDYHADILCCHGYKSNLVGILAGRRARIPVVSVSRGWTWEDWRIRMYEAIDRGVLPWMDHVVCVSEGQAKKVRQAGVQQDRISVIRNAVEMDRFIGPDNAYRQRLRGFFPESPRLIVGAAGRLSPEKGFDVLIDSAARVIKEHPRTGFVLFGEGALRDRLSRQLRSLGLDRHFILAGFHTDFDRYLPHLDLFVQSSFTEGLPNVILESLAAGVPVVATNVGGTPEVVQDGIGGVLVPPGDSSTLARRISEILADDHRRAELGSRGQDRVRRHFSFADQAVRYQELWENLVPGAAQSSISRVVNCTVR